MGLDAPLARQRQIALVITMKSLKWRIGCLAVALFGASAFAQAQIVGTPTTGARPVIVTVEELMKKQEGFERVKRIREEQDVFIAKKQNPRAPEVSQWPPEKPGMQNIQAAFPFTVQTDFSAITTTEIAAYPPDTMGAAGPNQVMVCVNGRFKVLSETGVVGGLNVDPDVFFSSVMRAGSFTSDPRVRFDRLSNRWFIVMIDVTNSLTPNRVLIAVSSGPTITNSSSFALYQFPFSTFGGGGTTDASNFLDYPTLGIDEDALYIGGNCFTSAGSFSNTTGFVIRKSSLTSGGPIVGSAFRGLASTTWGNGAMITPQGCDNIESGTTEGYFAAVSNTIFSALVVRRVTNPDTTPVLGAPTVVTVPSTYYPLSVTCLGSSGALDALDDRLFLAQVRRDRVNNRTTLWTSHNVRVSTAGVSSSAGTRTGTRWYELDNLTTTPTLRQSGTLFSNATTSPNAYWIPSINMNGQGHALVGCSVGGAALRPSVGVAARLSSDALGTISDPFNSFVSTVNYGFPTNRWGDYSMVDVDPEDNMSFWNFQMFSQGTNAWGVRVQKIRSLAPSITSIAPTSGQQGQTLNVVVTGANLYDPGASFPLRLTAQFGTNITVNSVTWASPTSATVNITIGAAAALGLRNITLTNPDSQVTNTIGFTVNPGAQPPTITSISPTNRNTLSPAFTLTVNGTNFTASSVVLWNGAARTTTFVSSTQLTAAIPASDLGSPGNFPVSVNTPAVGTSGTLGFSVTNTVVNGTVTLANLANPAGRSVTVLIANGSTIVDSRSVTLGAGGTFSYSLPIAAGSYDVYVKASHWLQKVTNGVVFPVTGPASFSAGTLINGDVNNDNEVGPGDFTALAAAFGTSLGDPGYNAEADLNGDDEVGPADFTILSASFGQSGDAP